VRVVDRVIARIARARARPILIGAWLAAFAYGFPGYLMTDSIAQLYQARSGVYDDWHPPLMARLWALIEHVVTGPIGMLALQLGLLVAGVFALARRRLAPGPAAAVTACVVLFPPVLTPMAVVWKDALMAGFLAAGAALATSGRRRDLALAAACLFGAAGVRYNAALAIVPLAIAGARAHLGARPRATLAGVAAALAITGAALAADRALTDQPAHPWSRSLAMLDLAGTIRYADTLTDDEVRAELAGVPLHADHDLQARARAARNWWEWWPATDGPDRLFDPPATEAERDAVTDAWWRIVLDHPGAWLEHRAHVFGVVLGLGAGAPADAVHHTFMDLEEQRRNLHFDAKPSALQRALAAAFGALAETPLYRPVLYLVLAIVLLVRRRDHAALLASGLAFEAGLFVVAPSTDFRYSHWMIVATITAAAIRAAAHVGSWRADYASAARIAEPARASNMQNTISPGAA
jgi:hypothetical protein